MEVTSNEITIKPKTHSYTVVNHVDNQPDADMCDGNKAAEDLRFLKTKNPASVLIHRSNSITIPVSQRLVTSNDSTYSRSYNCNHSHVSNYGTMNNKLCNSKGKSSSVNDNGQKMSTSSSNESSSIQVPIIVKTLTINFKNVYNLYGRKIAEGGKYAAIILKNLNLLFERNEVNLLSAI